MLLLTQSTLFFRDLALNTRAKNVVLDCEVEKWHAGVEAAKSPANSAPTTVSSSFHQGPPPSTRGTNATKSTVPTSVSKQSKEAPPPPTNSPVEEALNPKIFGDGVNEDDERAQFVGYSSGPSSVMEVCTTILPYATIALTWIYSSLWLLTVMVNETPPPLAWLPTSTQPTQVLANEKS